MGATPDDGLMVRTALNAVTNEWETLVQSILGRAQLPNWGVMWAILQQEEIRRMTKKEFSSGGSKVKKEEDATLASKGQRQQGKKKNDLSKVWCFRCGELGHFTSTCPKRKDKESSDSKAATARGDSGSEDDVAMSAHVP